MCTLVTAFYPQTKTPLVIASNRDENPTRPCTPWEIRKFSWEDDDYYLELSNMIAPNIYCPLDVLGGTWIGVNSCGIFCALTNWDFEENFHGRGLLSRGHLVLNSLKRNTIEDIVKYWGKLEAKNHKPFNMLAGNTSELYLLSCDNKRLTITKLKAGVHISTGIGFNQNVPRDIFIRKELSSNICDLSQPIAPRILIGLMGTHDCGIGSEDSICVHDKEHKWETRSTALLVNDEKSWKVMSKDGPACKTENSIVEYLTINRFGRIEG